MDVTENENDGNSILVDLEDVDAQDVDSYDAVSLQLQEMKRSSK
jgi:hypothetical protein